MGKLRTLIRDYIARLVLRNLSVDNVKAAIEALIGYLECKAKETETILDDWVITALRSIIDDDAKMARIFEFIQECVQQTDGVCKSLPPAADSQWQALAADMAESKADETKTDGTCCAIGAAQWLTILQLVLPPIIEAFERMLKEKE